MAFYDYNESDEVWYPIPSFPGYEIGSEFNVRTSWSIEPRKKGVFDPHSKSWRPVKIYHPPRSYPGFDAYKQDSGRNVRAFLVIHRVIAELIYGPISDGLFVLHYDDDRMNMYPSNLRYGTRSENCADTLRNKASKRDKEALDRLPDFIRYGIRKDRETRREFDLPR